MNWTHKPFTHREIHLRFVFCIGFLIAVILSGVVGYRFIENWSWIDCLYMTALTISTVGFNEVHDLSTAGTLFTIILIFFGVGTVAFAISSLIEMVLQRQLRIFTERRSMTKDIRKLKAHTIICGYGRMGRFIVDGLAASSTRLVVVESDPERVLECQQKSILVIQGNATEDEILEEAGIHQADALVATLGTDADNLLLTLTARGMNPSLQIIVRAENQRVSQKFRQAGADQVVSPHVTGASHIVHLLLQPDVVNFVEMFTHGDEEFQLGIKKIEVAADSPFINKTLADSQIRQETGCMILAIKRAGGPTVFSPGSTTIIMPGDVLIAVGIKGNCPADSE